MRSTVALAVSFSLSVFAGSSQRPDLSGTWTLPSDAPVGPTGKPTPAPGHGATINIRQDANTIVISKTLGGQTVHVMHPLDGVESRSRTPGRLCEGDSEAVWTAAWHGEAIVTTFLGVRLPGATSQTKSDLKTSYRLQSSETLVVETAFPATATREARTTTTLYRRSGPPSAAPVEPPAPAAQASISQLDWLGGTWIGDTGGEERWTPPGGGSMLAVARTLRNGAMTEFEFLCIVERNGGLVYQAMPNGRQPPTDFTLTKMEPGSLTFENPAHDFPKAIRYTLRSDGTLEAVISGTASQKPRTFTFRKQ